MIHIWKTERFVSKRSQLQPHFHSKAWVLSTHVKWSVKKGNKENLSLMRPSWFFSADYRWYIPCGDWSRRALRLRRLDPVASGNSRLQSVNSPHWRISCLANKTRVHPCAKWHSTLRVLHVCRCVVLFGRDYCGLHDNHVPKCLLWSNWCNDNHRYNNDPCTSVC